MSIWHPYFRPWPARLQKALQKNVDAGNLTEARKNLAAMAEPGFQTTVLDSESFLDAVAGRLRIKLAV